MTHHSKERLREDNQSECWIFHRKYWWWSKKKLSSF